MKNTSKQLADTSKKSRKTESGLDRSQVTESKYVYDQPWQIAERLLSSAFNNSYALNCPTWHTDE